MSTVFRRALRLAMVAAILVPTVGGATPIEKVLIPVFADEPIPGVNGSLWTTDMWAENSGDAVATVRGIVWDCLLPECNLPAPLPSEITIRTAPLAVGGLRGTLISVEADDPRQTGFGLRFRDLSRQSTTWGTELPAPREGAFRTSRFSLIDVPVTEGFRQTLRIYELDGTPRDAVVRVRIYRLDPDRRWVNEGPDELLGETELALSFGGIPDELIEYPGYAEVTDLAAIAPLGDAERLRIEIEPVTEGLRLWAFVTIIQNDTQHATVISPQ